MVPAVVEVADKNCAEKVSVEPQKSTLIRHEPIHYHILPPNELHPCDKYGCAREAKYQLGGGYYCHDPATSHFREVAKTCQDEGFEVVEDVQTLDV